jgi:hypothetical protein
MPDRTLLLVTRSYPFGELGDSVFLKDEITSLADQFDNVVVAPTDPIGKLRRDVPPGLIVDATLSHRCRRSRALRAAVVSPAGIRLVRGETQLEWRAVTHPRSALRLLVGCGRAATAAAWAAERSGRSWPKPDVCYSFWLESHIHGLRSAFPEVPIVSRAHRGDIYLHEHIRAFLPLHRAAVGAADHVLSVSEDGAAFLRSQYPDMAGRIGVRRLGVVGAGALSRRSTDGVLRVMSCSALIRVKRPELLARSLAALSRHRTVHWTHFGDGPLRQELETFVRDQRGERFDVALQGAQPNEVVRRFLREEPVDVFANTSSSEGVPVSLMEAISSGVPIVATAVGGTPEIVNGCTGRLVAADPSPDAVAEAVEAAAEFDDGARQEVRAWWADHYDAARNYPEFAAWLRTLSARPCRE